VFSTKFFVLKNGWICGKAIMDFTPSRTLMLIQLFNQNKFFKHHQIWPPGFFPVFKTQITILWKTFWVDRDYKRKFAEGAERYTFIGLQKVF